MFQLELIPLIAREKFCDRSLPREPESQSMEDEEQVLAYFESGQINDGIMAAANFFHAAHTTSVIQSCQKVLDLGCGPGTQLIRVAELNPNTEFIGVDLSEEMLKKARNLAISKNISNVSFESDDITNLHLFDDNSFDGVISTVTLHHLPSLQHLADCFLQINRVLKPNGALYLSDFLRLKTLRSVLYFAYKYQNELPHILCLDYERSLRAAFLKEDFEKISPNLGPRNLNIYATAILPLMLCVKTQDYPVPPKIKSRILQNRQALSKKYKKEIDDLRNLFRLSGLNDDIFKI